MVERRKFKLVKHSMKVTDLDLLLGVLTNLKDELNLIDLDNCSLSSLNKLSYFVSSANSMDSEVLELFDIEEDTKAEVPESLTSITQMSEAQIDFLLKEICDLKGLVVLDKYTSVILIAQKTLIMSEFEKIRSKNVSDENIYSVMRMIEDKVDVSNLIKSAIRDIEKELNDDAIKILLQF